MKRNLIGLSVLLVAALTAACGSGDQNGGSGGTGTGGDDTGGTGGVGGASTGGSHTGGSASGGSATGGASTGGSHTGGSGGVGGGQPCGGIARLPCDAGEFCDFPDDTCGNADGQGTCLEKPKACDDLYDPVCGCNGTVYSNGCDAEAAGQDVNLLGGCTPPQGQFPCGSGFCAKAGEYCQIQISDVGGEPNSYVCLALPPNCQSDGATCACLSDVACGNNCELTDGGFTLTCPGG